MSDIILSIGATGSLSTTEVKLLAGSGISIGASGSDMEISALPASNLIACSVGRTGAYYSATGASGPVSWTVDVWDPSDMHDPLTDNSRINIPTTGLYLIYFNYSRSGVFSFLRIQKNGTTTLYNIPTSGDVARYLSLIQLLNSGDYIEVKMGSQVSSSCQLTYVADQYPYFAAYLIS